MCPCAQVPDLEVARIFYSEVLGLPMDPSRVGSQRGNVNVLWFNAGRQQVRRALDPDPAKEARPITHGPERPLTQLCSC